MTLADVGASNSVRLFCLEIGNTAKRLTRQQNFIPSSELDVFPDDKVKKWHKRIYYVFKSVKKNIVAKEENAHHKHFLTLFPQCFSSTSPQDYVVRKPILQKV